MAEAGDKEAPQFEPIEIGKPLPGVKAKKDLPEGQEWWQQRIPSEKGVLFYGIGQKRDGRTHWVNEENTLEVITSSFENGNVVSIKPGKSPHHPDTYKQVTS